MSGDELTVARSKIVTIWAEYIDPYGWVGLCRRGRVRLSTGIVRRDEKSARGAAASLAFKRWPSSPRQFADRDPRGTA